MSKKAYIKISRKDLLVDKPSLKNALARKTVSNKNLKQKTIPQKTIASAALSENSAVQKSVGHNPAPQKSVIEKPIAKKTTVTRHRKKREDTLASQVESSFCGIEWLQLAPKGVVFEGHHFVLILEDKSKKVQLPLRFPLQSGDMISVPNVMSIWKKSLATLQEKLFPLLDLKLQRCVFIPGKGEQHRVKVFFIKDGAEKFLESDLDRILGLCLEAKLPFYATRSFIQQAKVNDEENENFLQNQRWTDGRQKYLM